MAVSSSINKVEYTGNGVTAVFPFPRLFYNNADIKVYFNGVLQSSGYTVSGAGNPSGGIVTFSVAPLNGVEIVIIRIVPYTQNTDFTDFDGNPSTVTERAFDSLTMQTQQLAESQGRIVSVAIGSGLSSTLLPDPDETTSYLSATLSGGLEWKQLASISESLDTELSGLATNDLLIYNGTAWENSPTIANGNIANNSIALSKLENNFIASATATTITASDMLLFGDASDSNNSKRTTVQGILDLARIPLLHVREEQVSGVAAGGGTFSSGSYVPRILNTVKTNEILGSGLSSNEITLPAGTFFIFASAPAAAVGSHKARLYNVTVSAEIVPGTSTVTDPLASTSATRSYISGMFSLGSSSVVRIEHRCSSTSGGGFGGATSFGTEVYTEVLIWKVA